MAVAGKKRRKITVNGTGYIWFVRSDGEHDDLGSASTLQIIADDKRLVVSYPINQCATHNLLAIKFLNLGDREVASGTCRHVECPKWETDETITPGIVRKIILWCLEDREYVDLTHLGELVLKEPPTGYLRLVVSN